MAWSRCQFFTSVHVFYRSAFAVGISFSSRRIYRTLFPPCPKVSGWCWFFPLYSSWPSYLTWVAWQCSAYWPKCQTCWHSLSSTGSTLSTYTWLKQQHGKRWVCILWPLLNGMVGPLEFLLRTLSNQIIVAFVMNYRTTRRSSGFLLNGVHLASILLMAQFLKI